MSLSAMRPFRVQYDFNTALMLRRFNTRQLHLTLKSFHESIISICHIRSYQFCIYWYMEQYTRHRFETKGYILHAEGDAFPRRADIMGCANTRYDYLAIRHLLHLL